MRAGRICSPNVCVIQKTPCEIGSSVSVMLHLAQVSVTSHCNFNSQTEASFLDSLLVTTKWPYSIPEAITNSILTCYYSYSSFMDKFMLASPYASESIPSVMIPFPSNPGENFQNIVKSPPLSQFCLQILIPGLP